MDTIQAATADTQALATPETQVAPEAPVALATPDLNVLPSVLSDLKLLRSRIGAGATPITLPIPGFEGKLLARFKWVPADELAATSKSLRSIKDPTQQQLAAVADALVACNDEVYVKVNDKLEALLHEGAPVTFSNGIGLTLALGLPSPRSARDCVVAVFGNEYAMVDTATKLMSWLEDTTREVDEQHLGE